MAATSPRRATIEDVLDREDIDRLEIVDGSIVHKAIPTGEHGAGQLALGGTLYRRFDRKPGGRWPGGWWIATETHVLYESGDLYCHDVVGWRRERVLSRPSGFPIRVRPDWVGEVLSPSNEKRDFVEKPRVLHAAHYWILDAHEKVLIVHRWSADGYTIVASAMSGETLRAEPFEAVEIRVAVLFGDADEDE